MKNFFIITVVYFVMFSISLYSQEICETIQIQGEIINTTSDNGIYLTSKGNLKILFVFPERLENRDFAKRIKILSPKYLFVDEAHCISEWGHNFRLSYRKIKNFAEYISVKHISAFTATATPEVRDDIVKQLNFKKPKVFISHSEFISESK